MLGYEFQKQRKEKHGHDGQYTIFMKKRLGKEGWKELIRLEKVSVKLKKCLQDYPAVDKLALPTENV